MASKEDHNATYNDEEDDDDDEPLNDVVLDEDDDDVVIGDDDSDDADTNSTSSVPAASGPLLPPSNGSKPLPPPTPPVVHVFAGASTSVLVIAPMAATPVSERKSTDDSRRLFQRLWTDEDEIELLQGFLDYTTQRGRNWSGHHHDTTAFYDQIKSRIQLDCNKNQLVEKLRRLKKKYRTVVSRISSGKEFVFKSPHDQATFEISRNIWSNSIVNRPDDDDDDQNTHPNSVTPVTYNLNNAGDQWTPGAFTIDMNSSDKMKMHMGISVNRPRKRPRVVKTEEKIPRNANYSGYEAVDAALVKGHVEETLKSSLSPFLKQLVDNVVGGSDNGFGFVGGAKGIGSMAFNAIPMNFPSANLANGGVMGERWRKQQILELEVYSKRLELVQDQVKLALIELRTIGI